MNMNIFVELAVNKKNKPINVNLFIKLFIIYLNVNSYLQVQLN